MDKGESNMYIFGRCMYTHTHTQLNSNLVLSDCKICVMFFNCCTATMKINVKRRACRRRLFGAGGGRSQGSPIFPAAFPLGTQEEGTDIHMLWKLDVTT